MLHFPVKIVGIGRWFSFIFIPVSWTENASLLWFLPGGQLNSGLDLQAVLSLADDTGVVKPNVVKIVSDVRRALRGRQIVSGHGGLRDDGR